VGKGKDLRVNKRRWGRRKGLKIKNMVCVLLGSPYFKQYAVYVCSKLFILKS